MGCQCFYRLSAEKKSSSESYSYDTVSCCRYRRSCGVYSIYNVSILLFLEELYLHCFRYVIVLGVNRPIDSNIQCIYNTPLFLMLG